MDDLRDLYEVYVDEMRDCLEHKQYMLNSDKCFVEWVEENYPERMDEL